MTGEARRFAMDLRREWEQEVEGFRGFVVQVATDALAGVVEKSPVGNPTLWQGSAPVGYTGGTFRANWIVSIGSPDGQSQQSLDGFAGQNAQTLAAYLQYQSFPTIYLQNNLPYATRLEDGWSTQAPNGMVALTVVELEAKYDGSRAR